MNSKTDVADDDTNTIWHQQDAKVETYNDNINWFEQLFAPKFLLHFERSVAGKSVTEGCKTELQTEDLAELGLKEESLVSRACKKISPLDTAAIQNVYQRVWIMMKASAVDRDSKSENVPQDVALEPPHSTDDQLPRDSLIEPEIAKCIWNANEIDILREAYQSTRRENTKLCGRVTVLENEVTELTRIKKEQQKLIQHLSAQLELANSANQRFKMMAEHLKSELDVSSDSVKHLQSELADKDQLLCEKKRLEAAFAVAKWRLKQQVESTEAVWVTKLENMRIKWLAVETDLKNEVAKLVEKIDELTETLDKERTDHHRTRTGLEQLRLHFVSSPSNSENAVNQRSLLHFSLH